MYTENHTSDREYEAGKFFIIKRIRIATGQLKKRTIGEHIHAVAWVMSDSRGPGSFLKWCDAAGIDADDIRSRVC